MGRPAWTYFQDCEATTKSQYVGCPTGQWGGVHRGKLADIVRHFRAVVEKRDLLNSSRKWEYCLAEVEYPLQELLSYWEGSGSLADCRAVHIFACFFRDKVFELHESAKELDEEYGEGTVGQAPQELFPDDQSVIAEE